MALKWGIASAGKISHDFVNALGTNSDEHQIVAVAARDISRAKEFAEKFGIRNAYESYEELAKDPEVEVVYVGTLNPYHMEIAILMLDNNKHVLVEKPLCINEKQTRKLINYAERKQLFLMEAIWSRFFPSYQYLKKQINNGILGEIEKVDVSFGFDGLNSVDRLYKKELGGGTVLDLGVYVIQFCQWIFRQVPKSITASGSLNQEGVDMEMNAIIKYGDKKIATVQTSAMKTLDNAAIVKGTKGQITIPSFWCPTSIIDIDGVEKLWPLPEAKYNFNYMNSCGLRYEADEVRKCIRDGKIESDFVTHNESLLIANIEDEIRKQLGVVYPMDI